MWVSQRDTLQKFLYSSSQTERSLFARLFARADASESFCSRSQSASFFLLGLRGVENFPEHIPVQDRHQEKHLEQGKRNSDIWLLGKTEPLIPTVCVSAEWMKFYSKTRLLCKMTFWL